MLHIHKEMSPKQKRTEIILLCWHFFENPVPIVKIGVLDTIYEYTCAHIYTTTGLTYNAPGIDLIMAIQCWISMGFWNRNSLPFYVHSVRITWEEKRLFFKNNMEHEHGGNMAPKWLTWKTNKFWLEPFLSHVHLSDSHLWVDRRSLCHVNNYLA